MHKIWTDMFSLGLPVTEKILRSVIVYLFLIGGLRLAGKRELAQLNPFDLIVLLTLSNTVQNAIIGDDNTVLGGLDRRRHSAIDQFRCRAIPVSPSKARAYGRGRSDSADS